jgi:predicted dehydrogenase
LPQRNGVAVFGCGWAGQRHASAFVAQGATLRWAIDTDLGRAGKVAGLRAGAQSGASLEEALSDPAVAMVDVCLPHNLHVEVCLTAIAAGKDVLCEKPLAPSLDEADRITAAAKEADVLLMVAENECFSPLYLQIEELIADGVIGAPALVQATRECYLVDSFVNERPWWLSRETSGGGILLAGGIHDFAKLRMMLGEITLVYSLRAPQRFHRLQTEDTVVLALGFESGVVGTLVESFCMLGPTTATGDEVHRLRIDGEDGSIKVLPPDRIQITTTGGVRELTASAEDSFIVEVREFLDCVESRREPKTSARHQRRNLELVEAAYASIASGQPVHL